MPVRLRNPEEIEVFLTDEGLPEELDPEKEVSVTVRQATQGDMLKRADFNSEEGRVYRDNSVEVKQRWSFEQQKSDDVFLVLAGTKGLEIEDPAKPDSFKPPFRFTKSNGVSRLDMTKDEFIIAWGKLPGEFGEAIWRAVVKVNPQWNPNRKG